jgi:hypothetical protein
MPPGQTTSFFWLWVMGIVWSIGPWLAIGLSAVLATLAIQRVHRYAKTIETRPVKQGFRGFIRIVRDSYLHGFLTWSTLRIIIGCIAFGGLLTAGFYGFFQQNFQGSIQKMVEKQPIIESATNDKAEGEGVLESILIIGLISAGLTVLIGTKIYRSLSQRAKELSISAMIRGKPSPVIVKLFHDNKTIGIVVLVIGCWILWGFLTQIGGLAVILIPGLRAKSSIPGVMPATIAFLVILSILLYVLLFGPVAWFSFRNLKLHLRYIRENRIAKKLFHLQIIILGGALGMVLNLYFVNLLGKILWPVIFH